MFFQLVISIIVCSPFVGKGLLKSKTHLGLAFIFLCFLQNSGWLMIDWLIPLGTGVISIDEDFY